MVVHEVHDDMHVLEEFWDTNDESQEHVTFYIEIELSHGVGPLSIEESEEILSVGPSLYGFDASISLVDESFIILVHIYSPHNFISSTSFGNEYWVKGFFLLVPHEG